MKRIQWNNLTGKMVLRLLKGLGAGVFMVLILYFGGTEIIYPYIVTSNRFQDSSSEYIDDLQEYIYENNLSADDYEPLKAWVEGQGLGQMVISRDSWLLFDSSYSVGIEPGARKITSQALRLSYTVSFADGDAIVYVDDGSYEKYYNLLLAISVAIGLTVCLGIFARGMHEDIIYIRHLEKEVSFITEGNLEETLTISGSDELTDLAKGIDQMRLSLIEKERMEAELRQAQEKLVLGMSHDLRTPLTGLMTYMEILKQQQKEGRVSAEFIDKAMNKIVQIRGLSDEMFEYFLVTSQQEIEMESPGEIYSVFGDYLSELYSFLECNGFTMNTNELEWRPVCVSVSMEYLGRIFNNIISNLEKYADKSDDVQLGILYEEKRVGIFVENKIAPKDEYVKSTGIGTKNIALMMDQMGGEMQNKSTEGIYRITLYFPLHLQVVHIA